MLEVTILFATHRRLLVEKLATHVAIMDAGTLQAVLPARAALTRRDVKELLF
jgi:ABC-type dipeptide/oligopeptide/nickel transport system ATPase subunit